MTPTTFAAFVTALGDLAITGVSSGSRLDQPPLALQTANLPAQWVQLPESSEEPLTYQTNGGWPEMRAELIVAYEAKLQNMHAANWAATLAQLDNVLAALRATRAIGQGILTWTIRPGIVTVAEVDYWAVIAEVTAHG